MGSILIVDDKSTIRGLLARTLAGHDVVTARDGAEALAVVSTGHPLDVIVSDIRMPKLDGLTLLRHVKRAQPEIEVIIMTAYAEVGDAVEAMKAGAFDYLVKPFDPDEAVLAIERALEVRRLRLQTGLLRRELDEARGFGPFVGTSKEMQRVFALIDKAAAIEANVLISGASGTGKELVARSIHERGARREGPFVVLNCGALPTALAESEMFGHIRGAFTGAVTNKPGLFEIAGGGSIFLDEINSLPLPVQVKLNRAIEEQEGRRVGATASYAIDARVLAATNVDLQAEVQCGRFREDLYFRLNVLQIPLPGLRERKTDIPLLAQHFVGTLGTADQANRFSSDAMKAMLSYDWPGNVRELRNAVESALAVTEGPDVNVGDLPAHVRSASLEDLPVEHLAMLTYQEVLVVARETMMKSYLKALLAAFAGNVSAAAQHAGIERETLHRQAKRHGIIPADFRGARAASTSESGRHV